MCDRLVDRGLIRRETSTESRREVIVELKPAGTQLLTGVTAERRREIRRIVGNVPVAVRAPMVDALQAFSDAAGEVPDQAWAAGWDSR
jgi:DNA-binding MarR family transcriptional regulator